METLMRPRIVASLNELFATDNFTWLIPTPLQLYGLAVLAAGIVFLLRFRTGGLPRRIAWGCILAGGAGAFMGAKLLYVLRHFHSYLLMPSHIFAAGGSVSWGAYSGAFIAIALYLRYKKEPVLPGLDILAVSIPLGTVIGRWSCFLNGDDFGTITNLPWGVCYPHGSYAFAEQVNEGIISYTAAISAPVHPNQLYLSLNAFVIFILLNWFWKRCRQYPGLTVSLYAISYSLTRFFLEFFRDESPVEWFPGLIFPQVICLALMILGVLLAIRLLQKHNLFGLIKQKIHSPITERIKL